MGEKEGQLNVSSVSDEKIWNFVNSFAGKNAKIAVFGAGNIGSIVQDEFRDNGFEVDYFVDNSPAKQCRNFNGAPVVSVKKLKELCAKENIGIFIATVCADEILEQLKNEGLDEFVVAVDYNSVNNFWRMLFTHSGANTQNHTLYHTQYIRFLTAQVRPNTVLLVEPNDCHGEVIPGYAKYLLDLGYNVDLLITKKQAEYAPMCRFTDERIQQFSVPPLLIQDCLNSERVSQYRCIFFTSSRMYFENPTGVPLYEHIAGFDKTADKAVLVEHYYEYLNKEFLETRQSIVLGKYGTATAVNSHYFGNVNTTSKNKKTNFVIIGRKQASKRNYDLLIDAVQKLIGSGITNFKITLIGSGNIDIPPHLSCCFKQSGYVSYPELYEAVETADFFLPLLDPNNPDHNRYVYRDMSGNYLLMYGFRKPAIIARTFAGNPQFTEQNAVIYDRNEDLAAAMTQAIKMPQEKYAEMQNSLAELADGIYKESLENLREVINRLPLKSRTLEQIHNACRKTD